MCDPVTAALVVAGVVKGAGSIMAGDAAQSAANSQAAQVELQSRQRARGIRYQAKQTISAAKADYAASGVDVGSGSPIEAYRTISFNSEVDALNAIASGTATARSIRKSGRAQATAGYLEAGGSLLGAFGSASGAQGVSAGGGSGASATGNWSGPR